MKILYYINFFSVKEIKIKFKSYQINYKPQNIFVCRMIKFEFKIMNGKIRTLCLNSCFLETIINPENIFSGFSST
ncbi:hypothetical protein KUTeg_003684 [Tegillarca granosa]|uniref:Uncharacterized protein n=1 Tax=Tegillarca granosa TaxID=220873 RepID=A0ABQ9FMW5_TEGGR|nr:hypothetical protein KUTeg_003684 [Tegillarca granosa]